MMTRNGWITLAGLACLALALLSSRARAQDAIPCPDIRATLATVRSNNPKMTEHQAVEYLAALARSAGASERFIAKARACLSHG
jgi:hypothetical protein